MEDAAEFLTLHKLNDGDGESAIRLSSLEQFESYKDSERVPQILFLKDYPFPRWLCSIGARYDVNPDFLFRHFNFSSPGMPEYSGFPPQPSSTNVVQLRITSVGCWDTLNSGESIDSIRSESEAGMRAYLEDLRCLRRVALADSIVRHFYVYDRSHFSIEQTISIHLNSHDGRWDRESAFSFYSFV